MPYKHLHLAMLASQQQTSSIKAKITLLIMSNNNCHQACRQITLQHLRVLNHLQPSGGPFRWVSCPHYLGEIVIYAGLALLAGQELPLTLLILCWVVSSEPAK